MRTKRTSITIDEEDLTYIATNNLVISRLLRAAVEEHRRNFGVDEEVFKETRRKLALWIDNFNKLRHFVSQKGYWEEYIKDYGITE